LIRACAAAILFVASAAVAEPDDGGNLLPSHVSSQACKSCHEQQFRDWSDSHHDWALRSAMSESVLGDFDDGKLTQFGITSRFYRRDGGYFVETEGPDGRLAEFEILYAVGVTPLQQYLVALDGGRLQALSLAWDVPGKRWFHLYPDEAVAPEDPLHWTGRLQNWNSQCAECHSTDYVKGYSPETQSYSSTWRDMNVGCEACHGPGEAHVAWARAPDEFEPGNFAGTGTTGLSVDLTASEPGTEIEVCAACHARRQSVTSRSRRAGRPFLDDFVPALLREGLYHADGQILDEVYVYGSFLQSKMHAQGVRCSDCHEPHRLGTRAEGNALCTQCHGPEGNPRFPDLKPGLFDAASHHYHAPGSAGAECANCHMPAKTYMVVDPRRDHGFRIPRPDLSLALGTPNACTGCHAGRSDRWAADTVAAWYGPERRQEPHFGSALRAARAGLPDAEDLLVSLIADRAQPAIARATGLSLMPRYVSPESVKAYRAGLRDADPLVRAAAARALAPFAPDQRLVAAGHLLNDPFKTVRIAAAQTLAGVPPHMMSARQRAGFARAADEFVDAEMAAAERPESHLNLGTFHADRTHFSKAEAAYRTALRLDRSFVPTYVNLAELMRRRGEEAKAEAILRDAIVRVPDSAVAYHALGLALVRRERRQAAVDAFAKAAALDPDNLRYSYVFGIALNSIGETERAIRVLDEAHERRPHDRDTLVALITIHRDSGELPRARELAERLVKAHPNDPLARRLHREMKGLR
jgi:tetratricopeptide (TPR) repeat protein